MSNKERIYLRFINNFWFLAHFGSIKKTNKTFSHFIQLRVMSDTRYTLKNLYCEIVQNNKNDIVFIIIIITRAPSVYDKTWILQFTRKIHSEFSRMSVVIWRNKRKKMTDVSVVHNKNNNTMENKEKARCLRLLKLYGSRSILLNYRVLAIGMFHCLYIH